MNLFNKQIQLSILPTDPEAFSDIGQQQYNQELTAPGNGNYVNIIPCLFEAILNDYSDKLLPRDILFFVQILILYQSALSKNQKSIIYASDKLAKLLGYRAQEKRNMRSIVLKRVKKLEQVGFLGVTRSKNKKGSDEVNEIVPLLPNHIYDKIQYASSNSNVDSTRLANESNIQHILRTKLFVPITLDFAQSLLKDSMPHTHKLFFLNCIITAYKNYKTTGELSFSATSYELMSKNNISKRTLARILDYTKNQYPNYFIEIEHSYIKSDDIDCNRYDKSTFVISINPMIIPESFLHRKNITIAEETEVKVESISTDTRYLDEDNEAKKPDTYACSKAGVPKWKPSSAILEALNNKDKIINNKIKNTDAKNDEPLENNQTKPPTIVQTSSYEHLENEQSSFLSKSLKNSIKDFIDDLPPPSNLHSEYVSRTIKNISESKELRDDENDKPTTSNDKQNKELRHFYPLSEKDVDMLNFRANREFSTNFVNQLLLKLYIKYPEKRFKNKFTFLNYMQKALKKEKHQGPLVNHTTFRFNCNISVQECNMLEAERYLSSIENSHDTSYEMQLKRKIAGRFNTRLAYEILTQVEFRTNFDNRFVTALIPSKLTLSDRQIEVLNEQLEAVYGKNGYYIQVVDEAVEEEREEEEAIKPNKTNVSSCQTVKIAPDQQIISKIRAGVSLSSIEGNTAWHGIRKDLIEEFGKDIDNSWFAKAVVKENMLTFTLTLTMPNKFMADWTRNRYGYAISRIAGVLGFKYMEYNH